MIYLNLVILYGFVREAKRKSFIKFYCKSFSIQFKNVTY